jgi:hypothetical protein
MMPRDFLVRISFASFCTACCASASRYAWSILMVRARDVCSRTWLLACSAW